MSATNTAVTIIGVAGGSCSGKTTLIRKTQQLIGDKLSTTLFQDSYYIDQSDKFDRDGGAVNFDHPNAIDFTLLAQHLALLKQGQAIDVPVYDFATHKRQVKTTRLEPKRIVFVDGILILSQPPVVEQLDHSFFVDCDEVTRLDRRLERDTRERGRTRDGILAQFKSQVAPMHREFVQPSQIVAQHVLRQEQLRGENPLLDLCQKLCQN